MFLIIILLIASALYWLFMSPSSQVLGDFPYRAKTVEKHIALTFDDGPNEPYTSQILDILDEKKIKATFFQVGRCIEKYPEVTKRAFAAGHVIGNHSLSHQFTMYFRSPSFMQEIDKTQEIIKKTIGKTPALFRPPWLFRQPWLLKTAHSKSLHVVSGKFGHALEVFQPSGKKMADRVIRNVKPGQIIIFHDGFDARGGNRDQTVVAVSQIIDILRQQGYIFCTLDELLAISPYQD